MNGAKDYHNCSYKYISVVCRAASVSPIIFSDDTAVFEYEPFLTKPYFNKLALNQYHRLIFSLSVFGGEMIYKIIGLEQVEPEEIIMHEMSILSLANKLEKISMSQLNPEKHISSNFF